MADRVRCAVCNQKVYRDKRGRVMAHTYNVVGDNFGDPLKAVVCAGWDKGARP